MRRCSERFSSAHPPHLRCLKRAALTPIDRRELADRADLGLTEPVAQREPEVEPDCVPDDLSWELAARIGDGLHAPALPGTLPCRPPFRDIACRPPNAGGYIALSQRTVLLARRAAISIFWLASLKPMEGLRRPSLDDMVRLDKKLARKLMI